MPNCADFKDDCATDAFIQKQCAATCGVGAAKAAAPANDPKKDGYIKELEAVVDELAVPHRPYATLDELKSKIAKAPKGGADDGKKDAKIKELEGTVNELKTTLGKKDKMIKVLQNMVDELEANQAKASKAAAPANDPKKDGYIKELEVVVDELAVPHRPYASLDELKSKIAKAPKAADAKACPAADGATLDKKNRMIKVLQGMVDELEAKLAKK